MKKIIKCFIVGICISAFLCACKTSSVEFEQPKTTDSVNTSGSNSIENSIDFESQDDEQVSKEDSNEASFSVVPKILTVTNGYRFHNTIDDVTLVFKEIYLISEWDGIKPRNDSFLVMKVTATSNTPDERGLFHLPNTIVASNGMEYESINSNVRYYENSAGETIDVATEMNAMYVTKEEGKISAYNIDFLTGGNGTRYIVFDIPQKVALDPNSSLIFFGTTMKRYEGDVDSLNVYFSDYISLEK